MDYAPRGGRSLRIYKIVVTLVTGDALFRFTHKVNVHFVQMFTSTCTPCHNETIDTSIMLFETFVIELTAQA